jgi:PIN domain nuclease of toxin-antitoxin system
VTGRLLLDTHAFLWFILGSPQLSPRATAAIEAADEVLVSAATGYEITQKHARGRLPDAGAVARDVGGAAMAAGIAVLPISMTHAEAAGRLPRHHGDPFDRVLVAQALVEGLPLVSADAALDAFGVERLW